MAYNPNNPNYPPQQYQPPVPQPIYYPPKNLHQGREWSWKWKGGFFKIALMTAIFPLTIAGLNPSYVYSTGVNNIIIISLGLAVLVGVVDGLTFD
jgi:hypothetical protein